MEVLNLAVVALFESLSRNNIDKTRLLEGTGLPMDHFHDVKKKHTWNQFVKMYENCALQLGPEKAAREIAYYGVVNNELSHLRKIATGFLDVKTAYWYLAHYGSKHLFKNTVDFKYKKISSTEITIEIHIDPNLEDCPLLFETYAYLYENGPTLLGLPKAKVSLKMEEKKGIYHIKFFRTVYIGRIFSIFFDYLKGYKTTVQLLGEVEKQSHELSKLLEEKSQLLRMLSHDISNQVSIIDYRIKRVLKSETVQLDDRTSLEIAHRSTMNLKKILEDARKVEILSIKGIELAPVNLDDIFLSVSEQFKNKLEDKKITLKYKNNLPNEVRPVAEKTSLELNVLSNIISNAIKFSYANSIIKLEANFIRGCVYISITDNGVGISDEVKANLFNQSLNKSSLGTKNESGTGFGLGIVNHYVNLYGGKISVHRNYPTGTIFEIELQASLPNFAEDVYQFEGFEGCH